MYHFETMANRQNVGNYKQTLEADNHLVLSGAEMDYSTAPVICQAIEKFAQNGMFGYTFADDYYFNKIVTWMKNVRHLEISTDDIIVTHGTIFGLATAIRTFTNEGDGIIVQHPSFHHYDKEIERNHRQIVSNPLIDQNGVYLIDFDDLEKKMAHPKNKLFILCHPHNPTGKVFSKEELEKIAQLAQRYNVIVYSDEIFGEITFDHHEAISYLTIDPLNGIVATSLGKSFNLTGVNHANIFIKNSILKEKYMIQRNIEHFGSIDPFFYVALTAAYSEDGYHWLEEMKKHTWENYLMIKDFIEKELPELILSPLEGGFIVWIDFQNWHMTDEELRDYLEKELCIIADPGTIYKQSLCYRFNIATPRINIQKLLTRLNKHKTK